MMAAVVDYDLGYQLGGFVIVLLGHAAIAGRWYLNGPADGTNGAENVGCDWDVHRTFNLTLVRMILRIRLEKIGQSTELSPKLSIQLAALAAARYPGYLRRAEIYKCKQHEVTVLICCTPLSHLYKIILRCPSSLSDI